MAVWITHGIAAALLFAAGLFAGYGVPTEDSSAEARNAETAEERSASGDRTSNDDGADSTATEPISLISHSQLSSPPEIQSAELPKSVASTGHLAAIRQLIQRYIPGTDADTADIWVETYADMDLGEIEFILEQKRLSTAPDVEWNFSMPYTSAELSAERDRRASHQPADDAVRMVEANLRGAWSLGYRRTVVLPEVVGDSESSSVDETRPRCASFRCFELGTLIQSPIATHLALPDDTALMFRLEDGSLTRRGDFQILKDRRLGIVTSFGEHASADSTPLPENVTNVFVACDGRIGWLDNAGETTEAGRITVCKVTDLSKLQTEDGVFFTTSAPASVTSLDDAAYAIKSNTLERSNVDRSNEESLLSYLKSLRPNPAGRFGR